LDDLKEGENVSTVLDLITNLILKFDGKIDLNTLKNNLSIPHNLIDYYLEILEKSDLIEIKYPSNPFSTPIILALYFVIILHY
jgi:predicted AAA+ superfamily ATPase